MRKERGIIMIHPSYVELMKVVNDGVEIGEEPVVNSRYSIVIAAAKEHARSLQEMSRWQRKSVPETIIHRSRRTLRRKGKDFTGDIG